MIPKFLDHNRPAVAAMAPQRSPRVKPSRALSVGALCLAALSMGAISAQAAPFQAGNVVIYRVGATGGAATLTNASNPVFLDEYTPAGALVQSLALPTAIAGATQALTASGSATSEGLLARSPDGRFLTLTGYDAAPGVTGIAATSTSGATPVLRTIGRVGADGSIDTSTTTTSFSGNNIRSAITTDGTNLFVTGGATGIILQSLGGSGAGTLISNTATNFRQLNIQGDVDDSSLQLYASTSSGTAIRVGQVGEDVPTTTGQATVNLAGVPTTGSPYGFALFDLNPAVAGADTLYVADDSSAAAGGGIQKFSRTVAGGTFALSGTITATLPGGTTVANLRGLTATLTGSTVTLFATTGASGAANSSALYSATDTAGNGAAPSTTTATLVATGATGTAFRGVALAPAVTTANPTPTPIPPLATTGAIINEFRTSGPNGNLDEFVEIYNQNNTALNVSGWSLTSDGAPVGTLATPTVIPAYARLLFTGESYSLSAYAASDSILSGDLSPSKTLRLLNAAGATVDSVNAISLRGPTSLTSDYSFVRRMDGTGGAPQDTGADASDFNTVDVASTVGPDNISGATSGVLRLGAPGPQNLLSPIVANQFVTFVPASPPSVRVGSGNGGTLALRYVVSNPAGSGRTLTALRFRFTAVTAGTAATPANQNPSGGAFSGPADVRLISSSASGAILPLSLETPPNQPNGGGLNASASLSGLPAGGIAAGTSVTVEFLFNVIQRGNYKFLLNLEPVATTP